MVGGVPTPNVSWLLAWPATVTTTGPVVAPLGTGTAIWVSLQLVGIAEVPLNVTVLEPWAEPKFVPVMTTDVPTGADVGLSDVMESGLLLITFMLEDEVFPATSVASARMGFDPTARFTEHVNVPA
jgi:hypothetical protein